MHSGFSCSQNLRTVQPWAVKAWVIRWSRSTLVSSFFCHHSLFDLGGVKCAGHMCQKHPSMKTASLRVFHPTSTRERTSLIGRKSTRYLIPAECRSLRTRISQSVSRRFCRLMFFWTTADDAGGRYELDSRSVRWGPVVMGFGETAVLNGAGLPIGCYGSGGQCCEAALLYLLGRLSGRAWAACYLLFGSNISYWPGATYALRPDPETSCRLRGPRGRRHRRRSEQSRPGRSGRIWPIRSSLVSFSGHATTTGRPSSQTIKRRRQDHRVITTARPASVFLIGQAHDAPLVVPEA